MSRKEATLDQLLATFASYVSEKYSSPENFRRNVDLLLKGKRDRGGEAPYLVSLERNIVFLDALVREMERFLDRLIRSQTMTGGEIESALAAMEKDVHDRAARLHHEAFIEGTDKDFRELAAQRKAGGTEYREKLEFNYRYLMTVRILIVEFIAIAAAVLAEYGIAWGAHGAAGAKAAGGGAAEWNAMVPGVVTRIRNHIELTAHYYLGNVTVGEEPRETPQ